MKIVVREDLRVLRQAPGQTRPGFPGGAAGYALKRAQRAFCKSKERAKSTSSSGTDQPCQEPSSLRVKFVTFSPGQW